VESLEGSHAEMWLMFTFKEDTLIKKIQDVYITRLEAGALYEYFHVEQNNPAKGKGTKNLV